MKRGVFAFALVAALAAGAAPTEQKAKAHTVTMNTMKFAPASLQIRTGETVTWKNSDIVPHTVHAENITSPVIQPGQSFSWTAEKPGKIDYECSLHPDMKGTIIVK